MHSLHISGARHFSAKCPFLKQFVQSPNSRMTLILSANIHTLDTLQVSLVALFLTCYTCITCGWCKKIALKATYAQIPRLVCIQYETHPRDVSHSGLWILRNFVHGETFSLLLLNSARYNHAFLASFCYSITVSSVSNESVFAAFITLHISLCSKPSMHKVI